ncbi:pancreatic lipase-related protein 2-like [Babylonia areolata]|uniref:pancreatic lipase-related protein 2-like n=1 Tax=Babylonia areolata TaxID=304850 RepID=UPI003FD0D262
MAAIVRIVFLLALPLPLCSAWWWRREDNRRCFPEMYRDFQCYSRQLETNLLLPQSPQQQGIRFELYTSSHRSTPQVLHALDDSRNRLTDFDFDGQVAVVIHGFIHSARVDWVRTMVSQLLSVVPNVIAVDWSRGARAPNYPQAVANTRVVGAQLATLIRTLGAAPDRWHLIGHSLGAQVAGFAGAKFGPDLGFVSQKIGRITGLDPAAPLFEIHSAAHKLDPSDAIFVDVIHTDAKWGGFGVQERTGHVDFYPNGGTRMPGCTRTGIWSLINVGELFCSHNKAYEYFTASINRSSSHFTAYPCSTQGRWQTCGTCGSDGCNRMGYHASRYPAGLFVLQTGAIYPFHA